MYNICKGGNIMKKLLKKSLFLVLALFIFVPGISTFAQTELDVENYAIDPDGGSTSSFNSLQTASDIGTYSIDPGGGTTSSFKYPTTNVSATMGDILVTRSTSSSGLLGHTGIVIDAGYVVHIRGTGYHPAKISLASWFSSYPSTRVVRVGGLDIYTSAKAGQWAKNYQINYSTANYSLATTLTSYNPTYCSKIVWQAYKYGTGKNIGNLIYTQLVEPYLFINSPSTYTVAKVNWP